MRRSLWTFMEFETVGGRGVITRWVERELELEGEGEFHDALRYLEITPRDLWVRPQYSPFDPEIGEIRFKANGTQHRVFGFFLMDVKQYAMLVGAKKKGRNYDPRDAIETARKRRKLIETDRSQLSEYKNHKFEPVSEAEG